MFSNHARWSKEDESLLKGLCGQNKGYKEMLQYFPGRTVEALQLRAAKLGMKNPYVCVKYTRDKAFWDIPNPINAYYAGFIAADGYVSSVGNSFEMKIQLASVDEEILRLFMASIKSDAPIRVSKSYDKKRNKAHSNVGISIYEPAWEKPLREIWGLKERKTWDMSLPNIPEDLMPYWLAGFIDGDGCYHQNKRGFVSVSMVGASPTALEAFLTYSNKFPGKGQRARNVNQRKSQHSTIYYTSVGGEVAIRMAHGLMSLDCPHLPRKYAKVKSILESKPEFNLSLP